MSPKSEYLVDLIFKKLKKYQAKEIFLEKEILKKFINSLFIGSWIQKKINAILRKKYNYV